MAGLSKHYNVYKPTRLSQILLGEKLVTEAIRILEEEFLNPFGVGYNVLHNLSSRKEVVDDLALSILEVYKTEKR